MPPEKFSAAPNGIPRFTRERAREVLRAGQESAQQNPLPMVFGALVIGVVVGLLCGRREPISRDAGQMARDFLEDAAARLAHRFHWEGGARGRLRALGRRWEGARFW